MRARVACVDLLARDYAIVAPSAAADNAGTRSRSGRSEARAAASSPFRARSCRARSFTSARSTVVSLNGLITELDHSRQSGSTSRASRFGPPHIVFRFTPPSTRPPNGPGRRGDRHHRPRHRPATSTGWAGRRDLRRPAHAGNPGRAHPPLDARQGPLFAAPATSARGRRPGPNPRGGRAALAARRRRGGLYQ